jgi:hypothetical protein
MSSAVAAVAILFITQQLLMAMPATAVQNLLGSMQHCYKKNHAKDQTPLLLFKK